MFLFRYVFLIFVPVMSYALPIQSNPYSNTFALSEYLASNNTDYSSGSNVRTISQGRFIGGGVASVFIGLGIGHAVQGRWKEKGWIHTVVQGGTVLAYIGSAMFTFTGVDESTVITGLGITMGLGIVLLGSRIWEMIDVWLLPDSIKVISSNQQIGTFSSLYSYKAKVPGISLQWQF